MNEPTVSVIIPCYNAEKWIEDALRSATSQTMAPIEIICIDDGSTDATVTVISEISGRSPVPIKVVQQRNAGPAVARNVGIENARGEYLAFLDSDDKWYPEKLAQQMLLFTAPRQGKPPVVAVTSDVVLFTDRRRASRSRVIRQSRRASTRSRRKQIVLGQFNMFTSSLVVNADVARKVGGFDQELVQREDHLFLLACLRFGCMENLQSPLAMYRSHGTSMRHVARDPEHIWAINKAFREKAYDLYPELQCLDARIDAKIWRTIGGGWLKRGNIKAARSAFRKSVGLYPIDPYTWLLGARMCVQRMRVVTGRGTQG